MHHALMTHDSPATITIATRFCGPPTSGNGGYTCGLLANAIDGVAEITLLRPPPLARVMRIEHNVEGAALLHRDEIIARARPALVELDAPVPPSLEHAQSLAARYSGYHTHAFPTCFVCGPERVEGDGLCIFPVRETPTSPAVAAWTPRATVCDDAGVVLTEIVWAALDCPGYFGVAELGETAVLGRMTGAIYTRPHQDEHCVVLGWAIGTDGRKLHAGTALYSADGDLCAVSKQTWIRLPS